MHIRHQKSVAGVITGRVAMYMVNIPTAECTELLAGVDITMLHHEPEGARSESRERADSGESRSCLDTP